MSPAHRVFNDMARKPPNGLTFQPIHVAAMSHPQMQANLVKEHHV